MKILGIETSCDETAAAIVENLPTGEAGRIRILSSVVASSANIHAKTGGVIPEEAARQQIRSIIPVINTALSKAGCDEKDIDAIAVTIGPGLIGSLLVGVETAKTLAFLWRKPIIPVNHLVAHIYANWIETKKEPKLPAVALVVSGGHTDLVLIKDHGKLIWIGGTRDDAAGEAFDKTARLLKLPYPGGPAISKAAEKFQPGPKDRMNLFPRPMIKKQNFDFSFSGLKTAVFRQTENRKITKAEVSKLAAEIQEAIVDVLVEKSLRAVKKYQPKSFLLAGGVAANSRLREKFKSRIRNSKLGVDFFVPPPKLCTDNAVCIAACAFFIPTFVPWKKITANPQMTIA